MNNTIPNIVRLNIQLTKKCNQRCISCNSYTLSTKDEVDVVVFKKAIEQATDIFDIKNIAFTGGEPTVYPHIKELATFAKKRCPNVSITTNGYYCTSSDRIEELIDSGINRFSFSYHSVGDHDSFTRVPGCEKRLRFAVDYLAQRMHSVKDVYVKVGTLYTGSNISHIEEMFNLTDSLGVDLYIELLDNGIPVFSSSELSHDISTSFCEEDITRIRKLSETAKHSKILLDENGLKYMQKYFSGERIKGECPLWRTDLYIESNGNVRPGCWAMPPSGNINDMDLKSILKNESHSSSIAKMINRECNGCSCGYLMQAKYMAD